MLPTLALVWLLLTGNALAQPAGRLVRVALPISDSGTSETQIKRAIGRAIAELPKGAERPVLVLEFVPGKSEFGLGTDFGRALELARHLSSRELAQVKTVAFIPRAIKGHGVLVAMACEEIVMAPDAEMGEAALDEPSPDTVDPAVLAGYKQIADRRRTIPASVAIGFIDRDAEVLKVETAVSSQFVLRSELAALQEQQPVVSEVVIKRAGELGKFTGREGRELGFVKFLAADRRALAAALGIPQTVLEDDPAAGGEWQPIVVPLKGPIRGAQVTRVERMIDDRIRDNGVNFICVLIDSPGGSPEDSMRLASVLAELDPSTVRTVAFVPREARGDAALVALACDQLVMGENAVLGGGGAANLDDEQDIALVRETIREHLSPKKGRYWSLAAALIDPEMKVYRYTRKADGRVEYFAPEEVTELADADDWQQGDELTRPNMALKLRGKQAAEMGLARHLADDFQAFKQLYGLESDPDLVEPGWADYLIDRLASPSVGWLFLLVGLAALYAEVQSPGIGLGGFVATVAFTLFFWNRFFEGTAGWLEVMLFVAGLCSVLVEIFVLPGTVIFGLGGGLLILSSLILASQTFVFPHNEYQWSQLQNSMVSLLLVCVGLGVAVAVIRRYLPHAPWASGMLLDPPSGEELEQMSVRESIVDFRHLVGQQGTTTTPLVPSGKARFDGKAVDVIADGEMIERGQPVEVTSVQGNRVMVKSVRSS
jgi:membrane-bound ClpP family serine protease